jgi:Tfp pilus assembly protein FimV
MDELNSEVRDHLDAAKKLLKSHFAARGEDRAAELIANWIREESYPFSEDDVSKERERFDKAAVELTAKFESLTSLSADERGIVLKLLKSALANSEGNTLKSVLV